ncbi:MAG: hypothetical protein AAB017_00275, partial [Nitrospirota bacterium]
TSGVNGLHDYPTFTTQTPFMLIAFSVVIVTLSLEAWIFYLHRIKLVSGFSWQSTLCAVLILLINTVAFYLPMRIGQRRLQENSGVI